MLESLIRLSSNKASIWPSHTDQFLSAFQVKQLVGLDLSTALPTSRASPSFPE